MAWRTSPPFGLLFFFQHLPTERFAALPLFSQIVEDGFDLSLLFGR
jgi:hypothetical protein